MHQLTILLHISVDSSCISCYKNGLFLVIGCSIWVDIFVSGQSSQILSRLFVLSAGMKASSIVKYFSTLEM